MIVSTKGRYALRVMIDLAEHQAEKYVPLKEVAARQEISEKYLENILKVLVQNGFLEGLRGKGGGYRLTRSHRPRHPGPGQTDVETRRDVLPGPERHLADRLAGACAGKLHHGADRHPGL